MLARLWLYSLGSTYQLSVISPHNTMLCLLNRQMGLAKMCPFPLRSDHLPDIRKIRCLLNEVLHKHSFSWRLLNSRVRHSVKGSSLVTGPIAEAL